MDYPVNAQDIRADGGCTLVADVEVDDSKFYVVEVGSRGDITYTKADLEAEDWAVKLTLG